MTGLHFYYFTRSTFSSQNFNTVHIFKLKYPPCPHFHIPCFHTVQSLINWSTFLQHIFAISLHFQVKVLTQSIFQVEISTQSTFSRILHSIFLQQICSLKSTFWVKILTLSIFSSRNIMHPVHILTISFTRSRFSSKRIPRSTFLQHILFTQSAF